MTEEFLQRIKITKSENTWQTYKQALDYMCPNNKPVFTVDFILSKINEMHMVGLSRNTIKQRIASYGRFIKYCSKKISIPSMEDILEVISEYDSETKVQPCPTKEQINKTLSTINSPKYKAIFLLMAYSGLRISEVIGLDLTDYQESYMVVRNVKNKQDEIVRVSTCTQQVIDDYISNNRHSTSNALFTTTHGRLEKSVAQKIIKRYFTLAGYPEYHAHSLRRYFCNTLISNNVTAPIVQAAMRHKSINSTQRYFNVNHDLVFDTVSKVFD
jgi:integrase/recombinase XerD